MKLLPYCLTSLCLQPHQKFDNNNTMSNPMSQPQGKKLAKAKRSAKRKQEAAQFVKIKRRLNRNGIVPEVDNGEALFVVEEPAAE
jgi:hypothetical protein